MAHEELYRAILARRSVRRYDAAPLDEQTLGRVRDIASSAWPLVAGNLYKVTVSPVAGGSDLLAAMGGYGWLVNPPCHLLPYMVGRQHLLEDLGYRAEQIAVRLTMLGLGSCFIGCLGREEVVRARFALPPEARVGALLIVGWPSAAAGGRAVNALVRAAAGATRKLPAERIFFHDTFAAPASPPAELEPLIEAARHAPSAVDAQPWRFLWRGGWLHLFVRRRNPRYGIGPGQQYNRYDGGICMANVALALEALGIDGHWALDEDSDQEAPPHPEELMPLARLALAEGALGGHR